MTHPIFNNPSLWRCDAPYAARQHPPDQIRRVVPGGLAAAKPPGTTLYVVAAVALERAKARSSATAATIKGQYVFAQNGRCRT